MSKIEWTDRSDWGAIRGCTRESEGCRNCYAEQIAGRFSGPGQPFHGFAERTSKGARWTGKVELIEDRLTLPMRWKKPARVFVNSAFDLFHESIPDEWIDRVFAVMALAPKHTFQCLSKRSTRMRAYMTAFKTPARIASSGLRAAIINFEAQRPLIFNATWPLPNVHLGVSCEDQQRANERIPDLLATPAAVRFVSAEPLLSAIDFTMIPKPLEYTPAPGPTPAPVVIDALRGTEGMPSGRGGVTKMRRLNQIIVGGESGPNARPMHPDWARSIRDQCAAARVPFFFKQWGEWGHHKLRAGGDLGGDLRSGRVRHLCRDRENDGHFRKGDCYVERVGKHRAGRIIDGREHSEFPKVTEPE